MIWLSGLSPPIVVINNTNKQAWLKEGPIYIFLSSFLLPLLLLSDWHMKQHIQCGHLHMTLRTPFSLQTPKDLDWSCVEFSQGIGQFLLSKHGLFTQGVYSAASHKPCCSQLQPQCLKVSYPWYFHCFSIDIKYFSMSLLHFLFCSIAKNRWENERTMRAT